MIDSRKLALEALMKLPDSGSVEDYGINFEIVEAFLRESIKSDLAAKVETIGPIEGVNFRRDGDACVPIYPGVNPHATPQQAVPAGFVLVPIEPTEEMNIAFNAAVCLWLTEIGDDGDIYKAIIKAAPRPAA